MARPDREEMLRNRRLETFVSSPLWQHFVRGCWRRYLQVRAVTLRDEDGRFRGGYADVITWLWTAPCKTEEDARRALFPVLEAFAVARSAQEATEARAFIAEEKAAGRWVAPVSFTKEEVADWVEDDFGPEDFDFETEKYVLTDEERQEFAEEAAEIAAMAVENDGLPTTPPLDFPPLRKGAGAPPKF